MFWKILDIARVAIKIIAIIANVLLSLYLITYVFIDLVFDKKITSDSNIILVLFSIIAIILYNKYNE